MTNRRSDPGSVRRGNRASKFLADIQFLQSPPGWEPAKEGSGGSGGAGPSPYLGFFYEYATGQTARSQVGATVSVCDRVRINECIVEAINVLLCSYARDEAVRTHIPPQPPTTSAQTITSEHLSPEPPARLLTSTSDVRLSKPGDRVEWESSQGTVSGKVKKKLIKPTDIKGPPRRGLARSTRNSSSRARDRCPGRAQA